MTDIIVRDLSDEVAALLMTIAKRTHRSREEFLRAELTHIAYAHADERYKNITDLMFNRLLYQLQVNTKAIVTLVAAGLLPNTFINEHGEINVVKSDDAE